MTDPPVDDASAHRRAWETIPWVVNGSATAEQRQLVDAHLSRCADCRSELAHQRELQSAIASAPQAAARDVDTGLQSLFARIDRASEADLPAPAVTPHRKVPRTSASGLTAWLTAAVVVEALALALLGVGLLVRPEPAPGYATLSEGAPNRGATIRIVPAPSMRIHDLQRLLQLLNLQVVAGPNSVGAYDLAPQGEQPARELQISTLRADPGLRLVEPIDTPVSSR
jgi:anti-sigma factor RsiW